ncbi:MAG: hypothetical protein AAFS06_23585 [Cyanobacteria bacterium J06631_12]
MGVAEMVLEAVQTLPTEQQQQVLEYARMLQRDVETSAYGEALNQGQDWHSHPAIGMWEERDDMKDSVEWVKSVRRQQWRHE